MQKLHLVGFTADFDGLIFSARKGAKSGNFVVPIDGRLLKQIAEADRMRDGGSSGGGPGTTRLGSPRLVRPESGLTPREIQDRVRAGWTLDDVAAEAGVDLDWVGRFAAPVLAELRRIIDEARQAVYDKPRFGLSAQPLGASVRRNVLDRGVRLTDDEFEDGWTAYQLDEDRWVVRFVYQSRGRAQEAEWVYDVEGEELTSRNRLGSQLGHVTPRRGRRPAPAVRAPAPPRKKSSSTAAKRSPAAKKAAPRKSAAPRKAAAPRRSAARSTSARRATPAKKPAKERAPERPAPMPVHQRPRPVVPTMVTPRPAPPPRPVPRPAVPAAFAPPPTRPEPRPEPRGEPRPEPRPERPPVFQEAEPPARPVQRPFDPREIDLPGPTAPPPPVRRPPPPPPPPPEPEPVAQAEDDGEDDDEGIVRIDSRRPPRQAVFRDVERAAPEASPSPPPPSQAPPPLSPAPAARPARPRRTEPLRVRAE